MKGYELRFNVYADSPQEVEAARQAITAFIDSHAREGRAVTARKIADAISGWDSNPLIRMRIINYFS